MKTSALEVQPVRKGDHQPPSRSNSQLTVLVTILQNLKSRPTRLVSTRHHTTTRPHAHTNESPLPDEAAEEHGGVQVAPLAQDQGERGRPRYGGIGTRVEAVSRCNANSDRACVYECEPKAGASPVD